MCRIFAGQAPENYEYVTRSVRLAGHSTSIRLERSFWRTLEEIAVAQKMSLPKFLTILHQEVVELRGEAVNFTSLLRCACLTYVREVRGDTARQSALETEAQTALVAAE